MKAHDKRRLRELLIGIFDAIMEQPDTQAVFEAWDAQLGVSGKAKRLATAKVGTPEHSEALVAFTSATAGPDLWGALLGRTADDLIRNTFGFRVDDPLRMMLSEGLVRRFVEWAAEQGGSPLPTSEPDFSPPLGRTFQFTVQAGLPTSAVRAMLARGGQFDDFRDTVRAAIEAAERQDRDAEKGGHNKVASYQESPLRRAGRRLFLIESKRRTRNGLAGERHKTQSKRHDANHPLPCEVCGNTVDRDVREGRFLLDLAQRWRTNTKS